MSLLNVDEEERGLIFVLLVEFVERGNLPAKGRSGIASEYQDNWLLAPEGREPYSRSLAMFLEIKVGSEVAGLEHSLSRAEPH
jgi:hypothetical protein